MAEKKSKRKWYDDNRVVIGILLIPLIFTGFIVLLYLYHGRYADALGYGTICFAGVKLISCIISKYKIEKSLISILLGFSGAVVCWLVIIVAYRLIMAAILK